MRYYLPSLPEVGTGHVRSDREGRSRGAARGAMTDLAMRIRNYQDKQASSTHWWPLGARLIIDATRLRPALPHPLPNNDSQRFWIQPSTNRSFSHTLMLDDHCHLPPAEEIESYSTLYGVPCLMTAVATKEQPLRGQKRGRRAIEEEHWTTARSQPPWKKVKRRFQSQQETDTVYWDSLSKLWLTRRALDELNRRNRQKASPVRTAVSRSLDLGDESGLLKNPPKQIKRFARHDGPNLCDLKGVSGV